MKRIKISTLLFTVVLLLSAIVFPVSAENGVFTVTADSKTAFPGEEVTVDIRITNNPGIAAFLLYADYDAGITLEEITRGDIISENGFWINAETIQTLPQRLYWTSEATQNMNEDGIYGSLKFKIPEDAEIGKSYHVYIYCYENDVINIDTEALTPVFINGGIVVDDPENPGSVDLSSLKNSSYEPPVNPNASPGSNVSDKSKEDSPSTSPIELVKSFFFGIVQGITEWLPISSTGHMILFDEFVTLSQSDEFKEMFFVVIQFGSILAVLTLYRNRLLPFGRKKTRREKSAIRSLWSKIIIAAVPAALVGVLFDDWIDKTFYNAWVVAIALILYGILFIIIERAKKGTSPRIEDAESIDFKTALGIGLFQVLSLIPGTSRSGSTIIGAMLLGVSRTAAAEFSFFLALPIMAGASLLKLFKFGIAFTAFELMILLVGMAVAFIVSLIAIRFLVNFVRKHSFEAFGWYRIALGIIVILYFVFR